MAVVNTCPYCNRSMSSDLIWCPHCEKIYPRTVTCDICYQAVNNTESIIKRKKTVIKAYYHPSCYREVLKEQTCPTCNYTFLEQEQDRFGREPTWNYTSCPNCGHQVINFFHCGCQMMGIEGKAAHVTAGANAVVDTGSYHQACVNARQMITDKNSKERTELLAHRKRSNLCLVCGKTISWC
jgi:hypothetical protein